MARIEFDCVEQKMQDLKGFCKSVWNPEQNPYTTDQLTDDEFNFVSGVNFAVSYLTDMFIHNYEAQPNEYESETLTKIKNETRQKDIEEFAQYGFSEICEMITSFIDDHEPEE